MPSILHEAILKLFQLRPTLVPKLLEEWLQSPLPDYDSVRAIHTTFSEVEPTEYRADFVVLMEHNGVAVRAAVVETQLSPDPDKRYSWPVYVASLRADQRCPVDLLVIAPDPGVAAWAAKKITLGSGASLQPIVLGPNNTPLVTDLDAAQQQPELALLSLVAHGKGEQAERVGEAALRATASLLDKSCSPLYLDLVLAAVTPAVCAKLTLLMKTKYEFQSDFAKKYVAIGEEQGREEGRGLGALEQLERQLRCLNIELEDGLRDRLEAAPRDIIGQISDDIVTLAPDADAIRMSVQQRLRPDEGPA